MIPQKLIDAINDNNLNLLESIITQDPKVVFEEIDSSGMKPLHLAAMNGNVEAVKLIIKRDPISLKPKDAYGRTPLHYAAAYGRVEVVNAIIAEDPTLLGVRDIDDDKTPLDYAAANGQVEVVNAIIAKDPTLLWARNRYDETPLDLAIITGNTEVAKTIIAQDSKLLRAQNKNGKTPLDLAITIGQGEVVEAIIEQDSKLLGGIDKDGKTPLHYAVMYGNVEAMTAIIAQDPKLLEAQDKNGKTPIMLLEIPNQDGTALISSPTYILKHRRQEMLNAIDLVKKEHSAQQKSLEKAVTQIQDTARRGNAHEVGNDLKRAAIDASYDPEIAKKALVSNNSAVKNSRKDLNSHAAEEAKKVMKNPSRKIIMAALVQLASFIAVIVSIYIQSQSTQRDRNM